MFGFRRLPLPPPPPPTFFFLCSRCFPTSKEELVLFYDVGLQYKAGTYYAQWRKKIIFRIIVVFLNAKVRPQLKIYLFFCFATCKQQN